MIEIKKVETKRDLKKFIQFHYDLYRGNKYDAPNLFSDEIFTLSKDKNAAFDFCEADYFMAFKDGKMVGRIAAIINHKANEKWKIKAVRFGWIDFIDDIEVSTLLVKTVEDWGKERGMEMIQGPLGFTDMDPEGMLAKGFEEPGTMPTIYNYEYYIKHFDQMPDFYIENTYVEYRMDVPKEVPEKYTKIAEAIKKRYNLHTHKLTKKEIYREGYGKKVFDLINATYKDLYGYSELSDRQIKQYTDMYFSYLDLDLVTLIEDWNDNRKPIGIGISIPAMGPAIQKCKNGRLLPFGWWHLLRALKFKKAKSVDMLLVGVLPEYRSKGANALLFTDLIPQYNKFKFQWAETQVEMESNSAVQSQWAALNPVQHKRRNCYAKKFS